MSRSAFAFERVGLSGLSVLVRHGHRWWSWPPAKLQTHCLRNEDPRLPLTAREPKSSRRYQQLQPLATSRPKGRPLSTLHPSSVSSWLALVGLAGLRGAGRHLHPGGLAPNLQDCMEASNVRVTTCSFTAISQIDCMEASNFRVTTWCQSCYLHHKHFMNAAIFTETATGPSSRRQALFCGTICREAVKHPPIGSP